MVDDRDAETDGCTVKSLGAGERSRTEVRRLSVSA